LAKRGDGEGFGKDGYMVWIYGMDKKELIK
jgi:hypothetical protein